MHNGSLPRKPRKRKTKLIQNSVIQILENIVNAIPIDELKSRMLFFQPAANYCVVLKLYCETLGCWNFYILLIFRPRKRDENIWIIRHLINTVKLSSMSHGKSSLLDNVSEREAILVLFGFSEVNNTWLQRPSEQSYHVRANRPYFLSVYWRNRPRRMLREQEKRFSNYSAPAHELQKRRIENAVFAFIKWILTKHIMFQFFMGLPFLLIRAL